MSPRRLPPRYHVVLTACIAPPIARVERSDPTLRLEDYRHALRFWLSLDDERLRSLTFLENSGAELGELHALAHANNHRGIPLEFCSLADNTVPLGLGYGYAELGMLDQASQQCAAFAGSDLIIKTTGRLTFPQLPRLISRLPSSVKFVADAVNHHLPSRRNAENGVVRTQLLGFRPSVYRDHLFGLREQMLPQAGHRLIESVVYRALWPQRDDPDYLLRFPVECPPHGFAAHGYKNYSQPRERTKNLVRSLARRWAPFLWL